MAERVARAVLLAAGRGVRMGKEDGPPKCLLEFGGTTLLERHLSILERLGLRRVALGVGYRADRVEAALERYPGSIEVYTVVNPDYEQGSAVTLWTLREHLAGGGASLLMDADVLYDPALLQRLLDTEHESCFLLDRDFEDGPEPVRLGIRDGRPVEFRKGAQGEFDLVGESVGFFRLGQRTARDLAARSEAWIEAGRRDEPYEEILREELLEHPERFGWEDVTGLPWIEIDFPEDVVRAREEILPRLEEGSARR